MIDACDACLCRSHLIGFLAADIQRLLPPGRPARAEVLAADTETLLAALGPERRRAARMFLARFSADTARAEAERRWLDAACPHSQRYPAPLIDLPHPPPVLYATAIDRLPGADRPAVAVVGTRRPSEYGRTIAYRLGHDLGAAGVPVVSGLALGIDALAHRGCLDAGGGTVAVLAGGADVPYPRTNRSLYRDIRRHGAIVAEMPPGTRPHRWLFPARNRIMAALGRATVVVEAAARSGTLITADCASDLGRDVAAVPGWAIAPAAVGTNALLKQGAAVVTGVQDVLDLLFGAGVVEAPRPDEPVAREAGLERGEAHVLELVREGLTIDELAARTELGAGPVRAVLGRLELRGLVRRTPSGAFVPAT